MNIKLVVIGKTDDQRIKSLCDDYESRIGHYIKYDFELIPDLKNRKKLSIEQQKQKEGELILERLSSSDYLVLLDEKGKEFSSVKFADQLQKFMNSGLKQIIFTIGGPYGFSQDVYQRANFKISLSQMTFSHQMVRIFILEQIYRAFTILRNEPYHHE